MSSARVRSSWSRPRPADVDALAAYVNTVLEGLSIQACDGTSGQTVHAIIDCALAGCDTAAARPTRLRG